MNGWKTRAKNRVTKEQEEVYRCYSHQYINMLLQACTEIILIRRYRAWKKHPIQLIGLSRCHQLFWERQSHDCSLTSSQQKMFQEQKGDKCYIQNILQEKKHLSQMSFSVSQDCEECSIKAAQSNQHAFHLCISHRPLESVSHCRHTPTGTVILDTKEQKRRQGDIEMHKVLCYESGEQLADKWRVPLWSQHPAFRRRVRRFSVFLALPFFPQKRIQSGLTFGLYKWKSSSSSTSYWKRTRRRISNAPLCLFINSIWPKSADLHHTFTSNLCWHFGGSQSRVGLNTTEYERISPWNTLP